MLFVTAAPFAPAAVDELRGVVPILQALGIDARWRALTDGVAGARAIGDALRGGEAATEDDPAIAAWRGQRVEHDADVVVACGPEALPALQGDARRVLRLHGRVGAGPAWELADGATVIAEDAAFVEREAAGRGAGRRPAVAAPPRAAAAQHRAPRPRRRAWTSSIRSPLRCSTSTPTCCPRTPSTSGAPRAGVGRATCSSRCARASRTATSGRGTRSASSTTTRSDLDGVHVIADVAGHGDGVVNAVQRLARAAIAVDQGCGLPTAEALLKGTPVVAAPGPRRRRCVGRGVTAASERGQRLHALVEDPGLAAEQGRDGAAKVRERFLVTRVVRDLLGLLA